MVTVLYSWQNCGKEAEGTYRIFTVLHDCKWCFKHAYNSFMIYRFQLNEVVLTFCASKIGISFLYKYALGPETRNFTFV